LLVPTGAVRAYPGPVHYAGDVLTFEIQLDGFVEDDEGTASLTVDGGTPYEVPALWRADRLVLLQALDTSALSGLHEVRLLARNGDAVAETYRFEVRPASERPQQEADAAWRSHDIPCCTLHFISGTAAARDVDLIAERIQAAAEDFEDLTEVAIAHQLEVYFIDRMWGNGAFGGEGELLVAYTDRYYGPTVDLDGLHTLALHEFTHATKIDQGAHGFFLYNEGLAVYLAGGHYKPEPLPERGAALHALGYFEPGSWDYPRHEASYLHGAAVVAYVVETYGWEALWRFVDEASGDPAYVPETLDAILQEIFGRSKEQFEADFVAWLQSHGPGEQLDDLRLTLELQGLRRQYQDTYAPPPYFIFGEADETFARPEFVPAVIREARAPANVAVELMIAHGQEAIVAGRYADAQAVVGALEAVLASGTLTHPLAADYVAVVLALSEQGYETLSLDVRGDQAVAQVTRSAPALEAVSLSRVDGAWQRDDP
jgi:hypothetical protein